MDSSQEDLSRKRKKYSKRYFLTTSKKCKRYRVNRPDEENEDPLISDCTTSSESDIDLQDDLSPSIKPNDVKPIYSLLVSSQTKSTQTRNLTKSSSTQYVANTKSRCMQTLKPRITSSGVQTSKEKTSAEKITQGSHLTSQLTSNCDFDRFAEKLKDHEQTEKFIKCITSLSNGSLAFTNMAWKSFLEMGSLLSCTSTTTIQYDTEWLEFCQVLYHMFGAGVINALRGRGHFSQVASNLTPKGKYNPVKGEFNFPIPSIPTLKKLDIGFPSEINVGFVEQSLQLAQKKALEEGGQFILSFDGKLVAPGCKGDSCGDSNMWGIEGPPNLTTAVKILKSTLRAAKAIEVDMSNVSTEEHFNNLKQLANVSSRRIKKLRGRMTGIFYLKKKLIDKCGDSEELQYKHRKRMSTLNQNTADCETVVRRLLEINLKITSIMAFMNSNGDMHISDKTRHINLSDLGNNFQLLPPEIVSQHTDLENDSNMQFIKQRSDKWFELRKKYLVTGSTLNTALGLDTLQKQKEHHYVHVRGRKPPPVPPDLQKKFDHGTRNEVNATATLISTVAPAYLPACYAFYEVGPSFIHNQEGKKILEVSSDGVMQCSLGRACPNYHIHGDRRILIEFKSPVPQENVAETIFYEVPNRYMPQLQSQMKAYMCEEVWLICSTAVSATTIMVYFDANLWEKMWTLLLELYGPDKPKVPTRVHPATKEIRLLISQSKQTHTSFLCEVPTVTGEYGAVTIPQNFNSPYAPAPARQEILKTNERITQENFMLYEDAKRAFNQCHEVLRDPGKELLVFMLTDKDRKQSKNVPYSYPIAYAMKGSSMTNKHLQYLVDKVRSELKERRIPILCEAYDGQWHKFITEDKNGKPLTKLHGRDNWNKVAAMSKEKCLNEISMLSVVKKSTHEVIEQQNIDTGCAFTVHGLKIEKGQRNELYASSTQRLMGILHSVHPVSRHDLYTKTLIQEETNIPNNALVLEEEKYLREPSGFKVKRKRKYLYKSVFEVKDTEVRKTEIKKSRIVGLQDNERSMLDIIHPPSQNNAVQNEMDDDQLNDGIIENECVETLEQYLRSDESYILPNILNELKNSNVEKWGGKTVEDLYPGFLTAGNVLMDEVTVKELNIICMELRCLTGRNWQSSNMIKAEIVNSIVKAFGGENFVPVERRKKKVFNPETLVTCCVNYIKGNEFPKEHIQIPIASLWQIQNRNTWKSNATIPMQCFVPGNEENEVRTLEFFSYPEYSTERDQVEFRTFDFTHVLTNLRTQILTRGFDYCKKEHFEYLSLKKPGLLSLALVFEKTDQQNAFTAMRMFNYDVEHFMRENKFEETANFIRIVRNWHEACNRRGLSADTRVTYLTEMHEFLTKGVNFDSVPFQYPGRYIKCITWQTYEALLQMISTRIQLYSFACNRSYNSRAVSTLSNESFFSDLVRYDKESHGYPKGTNVGRVFGRVVLINHFKHKRDKNYYLAATIKSKYEIKLADSNYRRYIRETAYHYHGLFRDHFFDFPNELKSQRVRRDDISTGLAALRTSGGVRRWHKTIESDLLPEIRGGNKVKGFKIQKNIY